MWCVAAGVAAADPIDLSSQTSFTLAHGEEMILQFSVWNYGKNNPGSSPYPTSVGLEIAGTPPAGAPVNTLTGSSGTYYSGDLLEGWISSLDGTASAPLYDHNAAKLGYGPGSLLLTPGSIYCNGAPTPAAMVDASVALTLDLSEQIFGPDVASRQSAADIYLLNLGNDVTIGLGRGYKLGSLISEPGVSGFGPAQTSGITESVTLVAELFQAQTEAVPEPATWMGAGVGMLIVSFAGRRWLAKKP